ncbi:hypothetical protein A2U01_0061055, partial [Trifolium medium]|nr:hypothetical protein [Trifolium medium]
MNESSPSRNQSKTGIKPLELAVFSGWTILRHFLFLVPHWRYVLTVTEMRLKSGSCEGNGFRALDFDAVNMQSMSCGRCE